MLSKKANALIDAEPAEVALGESHRHGAQRSEEDIVRAEIGLSRTFTNNSALLGVFLLGLGAITLACVHFNKYKGDTLDSQFSTVYSEFHDQE